MAELLLVREGSGPDRIASSRNISAAVIERHLGSRKAAYSGPELPTLATNRPDLTPFRNATHVFIRVAAEEAASSFPKAGCYLLENVTPAETKDWK